MTVAEVLISLLFMCCVFLVVWQPGDSAVVEWPVAERGLCIIRGVPRSGLRWAHLEHCKSHACTFKDSEPWQVEEYRYISRISGLSQIWLESLSQLISLLGCRKKSSYCLRCTRCLPWMPWRPPTRCPALKRRSMTLLRSAKCSTPSPTTRSAPIRQNFLQYLMPDLIHTYSIYYNFALSYFSQKYYKWCS